MLLLISNRSTLSSVSRITDLDHRVEFESDRCIIVDKNSAILNSTRVGFSRFESYGYLMSVSRYFAMQKLGYIWPILSIL